MRHKAASGPPEAGFHPLSGRDRRRPKRTTDTPTQGDRWSMARIPANPKIYHITHLRNLPQIVGAGMLWSDAKRLALGLQCDIVGMSKIKRRRLEELPVQCHPRTKVGQYVPFYFCPRSIMLYILHMGNHPELDYHEGQRPIVHLQADLAATVRWADENGVRWAFSDRNAGTHYAGFYSDLSQLDQVNWTAVQAIDFRDPTIKDGKQAEFLVYESFPWTLVEGSGVLDAGIQRRAEQALADAAHRPPVSVEPTWYY